MRCLFRPPDSRGPWPACWSPPNASNLWCPRLRFARLDGRRWRCQYVHDLSGLFGFGW